MFMFVDQDKLCRYPEYRKLRLLEAAHRKKLLEGGLKLNAWRSFEKELVKAKNDFIEMANGHPHRN
jgi:hypothetical protein